MEDVMAEEKYESDQVALVVHRQPMCMVEFNATAKPELVQKAYKKAIKIVAKQVSIPGFRKGKAPDDLIIKKYAAPLDEKWQKEIANTTFVECQKLIKVPILNRSSRISFNMDNYTLDGGATMKFTFETEPTVPKLDLSKVKLEESEKDVIDETKVNETLEQIQRFFAKAEKVKDRGAEENDTVIIDVDIIEEDPPQKALQGARFEVKKESMAKWMFELIVGMKEGESKDGISQPDEDTPENEKTPPKKVKVTIISIEKMILPPLDDELAVKVGVKTADELKENVQKLLEKKATEAVQQNLRNQTADQLIQAFPFDLPKTILDEEADYRVKQLQNDPYHQKRLAAMTEEEQKKEIEALYLQGERAVRLYYFSRQIIADHKIKIVPEEVHKEVNTPLDALFNSGSDFYLPENASQEQKALAMSRLMLTKAEDFVIEQWRKT